MAHQVESSFSRGKSKKPIFISHCSTAQDSSLSLAARGLLFYYVSLPENFKINATHVRKQNGNLGRDTFQKLNRELIEAGYLVRYQEIKPDGKRGAYNYEAFYDKEDARLCSQLHEKEVSYEQSRLSKIKSKKCPHNEYEPTPEPMNVGNSGILKESKVSLDSKQSKKEYYHTLKQENSRRSQVHNSSRVDEHAKRHQHSNHSKEFKDLEQTFSGHAFVGASRNAIEQAKVLGNQEHRTIKEMQEEFPSHWNLIDLLTENISWMQLYATLQECKRHWIFRESSSNPVKNKFKYFVTALKNYVINIKDSSLNKIVLLLESMQKIKFA